MYYEVFAELCEINGVKPGDVSRATGISSATLTNWKQGKYTPKQNKLQLIADYFGVSLDYLMTGKQPGKEGGYYFNEETAKVAQEIFEDRDLRILFDAARDSRPEDLRVAADFLKRLKETNPDA